MLKKFINFIFKNIFYILIIVILIILISLTFNKKDCIGSEFSDLEPKAVFGNYKIYDLIEQKGLMCAEAIEILGSDEKYSYYFSCLKSGQIYLVSDEEIIKVKNAYDAGIITKEELYDLNIVERMEKLLD